ncbi:PilZ domain-containing protein [Candidatus Halobeggiatoa sp. HSG11]|nr:PilZ domain-containing protein [Candidatus Halobeggiatoa sp. HSG11]
MIKKKKRTRGMKHNMLTLNIPDEMKLYNSFLPFLKRGGLFYPTEKSYKLGDEVFLLLTLLDDGEKTPVAGEIAWINPKGAQGQRPAGIGVHFGELDNGQTRSKIENLLVKIPKDKRTFTM